MKSQKAQIIPFPGQSRLRKGFLLVEICNAMCYNTNVISVKRLVWDNWNVIHIRRHHITVKEIEKVCHGKHIVLEGKKGRLLIIGETGEKILTVVLDPEPEEEIYYVVTARSADKKERTLYKKGG